MAEDQDVIKVPGKHRLALQDLAHVRIQDRDGSTWVELDTRVRDCLWRYLSYHSNSSSWQASSVSRLGFTEEGVFHHHDHSKRFFGLLRSAANRELLETAPSAVPKFSGGDFARDHIMMRMQTKIDSGVNDQLRSALMRACFNSIDSNKNGTISKQELGLLMRKLLHSISNRDLVALLDEADKNRDGKIDFDEFTEWMMSDKEQLSSAGKHLRKVLGSDADIVKGAFRVFDKSGNGVISMKEFKDIFFSCTTLDEKKINIIIDLIDTDGNGKVDYEEFVDFLFKK